MDDRLRELERAAQAGDRDAEAQLLREQVRRVQIDPEWEAWVEELREAHEFDSEERDLLVCNVNAACPTCGASHPALIGQPCPGCGGALDGIDCEECGCEDCAAREQALRRAEELASAAIDAALERDFAASRRLLDEALQAETRGDACESRRWGMVSEQLEAFEEWVEAGCPRPIAPEPAPGPPPPQAESEPEPAASGADALEPAGPSLWKVALILVVVSVLLGGVIAAS